MADHAPVDILLVEDNAGDVRLLEEAFKEGRLRVNLHIVRDGMKAVEFLWRHGPYADAPRPDLVLLDLNLPKKDGREVLAEVKANPQLRSIPVVILTTSSAEEDILKSYHAYANCYITKPVDLGRFMTVVRSLQDFWFTLVKLPSGE